MRLNIFIFILLSIIEVYAQTIEGRVIDEEGAPIGYANVVLLSPDSLFIDGTTTSDAGKFFFHSPTIKTNQFLLKVSCIGYAPLCIECNGDNPIELRMEVQSNTLSEVVVTPPTYKMKSNGLVVSIQNSSLSQLGDIGKMLEFIPGLQYNSDGLYVFGKGKPIIYLNGRILSDLSELERLNSSDIATVEVIKNPGAAYSADAQAVVKIRTIRKKGDGFSVSLRSYFQLAHKTRVGETVQTNYRSDKFDVFAFLNYLHANDYESENSTYDIKSLNPFSLNNILEKNIERNNYTGKVGFDYYFTPRQNIGAYYSYAYYDLNGNSSENASITEKEILADEQWYDTHSKLSSPAHRINAYYSGHIGSVDINFNNDFYSSSNKQSQQVEGLSDLNGVQNATTGNKLKTFLTASDLAFNYQRGINSFELGTTYNHTHRTNDYKSKGGIDLTEQQKIRERKWSLYANYQLSLNNWEITAGLRFERYQYDYFKNGKHIKEQSKTYKDFYPSLAIYHSLGDVDFSISYSVKSQKPPYNALDGNTQFVTQNLYTGGNPLLKPSVIRDAQLSLLYKGLIFSADYMVIKKPLYYTYRFYDDDQSVIISSYDNYPKVNIFQGEASYSKKFGVWKPQLTVDFLVCDYKFEQAGKIFKQNKPLVTLNFNHIFTLPRQWYLYLYSLYQTTGCNEEGLRLKDKSRVSLYVVKKWNNFSVDVLFNDIFKTYKNRYTAISPACTFHTSQYSDTQNIQINIRYTFNATRSKYKGADAAAEEFNRL